MAKPSTLVHSILSRISMACSSSVSCSRITGEATNGAPSNDTVRWEAISVVILVIHHLPNRIFHRMPRLLVVEGPGHPTLQIGATLPPWRSGSNPNRKALARRNDRHQMAHRAATLEL
jgi:hypothetical protein